MYKITDIAFCSDGTFSSFVSVNEALITARKRSLGQANIFAPVCYWNVLRSWSTYTPVVNVSICPYGYVSVILNTNISLHSGSTPITEFGVTT